MSKQLRIIDRLLLGISFIDQLLDETIGAGNRAYRTGRLFWWTPPNYQGDQLKQSIQRLLRSGYLEKRIIRGEPHLIISNKGKFRVERKFSYFKLQGRKWDGYWRLVIFDIKEKERWIRQQLRRKLKELGFGMWQKSIYISPHSLEEDMTEFLQEAKLFGKAYVLTARHHLLGEAKNLAEQVWHLSELNNEYLNLEERLGELNTLKGKSKLVEEKKICYDYSVLLTIDPCLPRELLPSNWTRPKIEKLIAEIIKQNIT